MIDNESNSFSCVYSSWLRCNRVVKSASLQERPERSPLGTKATVGVDYLLGNALAFFENFSKTWNAQLSFGFFSFGKM